MVRILFLNHAIKNCGVYQYGNRVYNILKKCTENEYIYHELSTYEEYLSIISLYTDLKCIIYNYHNSTMPWLNNYTIQKNIKNIGMPHESHCDFFDIKLDITSSDNSPYSLPRPLFENIDQILKDYKPSTPEIKKFIEYSEENIPIIGSFGFGFDDKGFHKIVELVNQQYDSAIIKIVIPVAHFDRNTNNFHTVLMAKNKCEVYNYKPNIKLLITHDFFTNEDLLLFLKSNTINIFMYDKMYGRGLSSTIDYALSVQKPLGISDSYMFRHIFDPCICLYNININECIQKSKKYCEKFLNIWSNNNFINTFKNIINNI